MLASMKRTQSRHAGELEDFAGPESKVPAGWLPCDGRAVSRSSYARLFDVLGTTWGAGDGSTTFNLPDMRGRATAAPDAMGGTAAGRASDSGLGDGRGAESKNSDGHTLTESETASHNHGGGLHVHGTPYDEGSGTTEALGTGASRGPMGASNNYTGNSFNIYNSGVTISMDGGDNAHAHTLDATQPTAVVNKIIKV